MKIEEIIKGGSINGIIKFLETAPEDELYTTQELNEKFGVPESTIKSSNTLRAFRTNFQGKNFFGSKGSITLFEQRMEEE